MKTKFERRKRKDQIKLMDHWNGGTHFRPLHAYHENSLINHVYNNFAFHQNHHYPLPPPLGVVAAAAHPVAAATEKNGNYHQHEKKKRMTSEQLESLERSFREEIKLDPDRKMQLARELGLPPRQVAIWFQNRRARWKAKQLEDLYDSLQQQFDVVCREKQKLQQEVSALKAILHEQGQKNPVTMGNSGEESNESASDRNGMSSDKTFRQENHVNYILNNNITGDYIPMGQSSPHNHVMANFWSHDQQPNSYNPNKN